MGRILNQFPNPPSVASLAYPQYLRNVRAFAETACPLNRSATYYVAQGGSFGGSGTIGSPFTVRDTADINALSTLIPQWGSSTGNFRLLLRCGDDFRPNTTTPQGSGIRMNVANVTIGSYVDSTITDDRRRLRPPRVTAFSAPVTSGWTQYLATNWYYRDYTLATKPCAVQFSDADATRGPDDVFKFYDNRYGGNQGGPFTNTADANLAAILADTTAENAFTIVWSTAPQYRIYVKLATGNPNTATSLEVLQGTGPGIQIGNVDGCRVDGILGEGWGFMNTAGSFSNQEPPILTTVAGNNMTLVTNSRARYSGTHHIEQYAATDGGTLVVDECEVAWGTGGLNYNCAMMTAFCPTTGNLGGNECVYLRTRMTAGALPVDSYLNNASASMDFLLVHTGSFSYPPALRISAYCTTDDNMPSAGTIPITFDTGDAPEPVDRTNLQNYRSHTYRCRHGASPRHLFVPLSRTAYFGMQVPRSRFGANNAATLHCNTVASGTFGYCPVLVNSDITIDCTQSTGNYLQLFNRPSGTNPYTVDCMNTRWTIITKNKRQALEFVNRFQTSTTQGHGNTRWVNTEVYATTTEAGMQLANTISVIMGFLNQTATAAQGGYLNCAFVGVQPASVSNILGYNSSSGFKDSTNTAGLLFFPAGNAVQDVLEGLGVAHPIAASDTQLDANGVPLVGTRSIGPYQSLDSLASGGGGGGFGAGFAVGFVTGESAGSAA